MTNLFSNLNLGFEGKDFEAYKVEAPILRTVFQGTVHMGIRPLLGGYQLLFFNSATETQESLSVICHAGSYGRDSGLFEMLPGFNKKKTGNFDSGEPSGFMTFNEVISAVRQYFNL